MMKLSDFDYNLPKELIAQAPAKPRDHSRLLLLDKKTGEINYKNFFNIIDFLKKGDVLVLNNSKVIPARLFGAKKGSGGQVEVFLHKKINKNTWECLLGGRVHENLEIIFSKNLSAKILKNNQDGTWQVQFSKADKNLQKIIEKIGIVPLPPYIKRDEKLSTDKKNYQTVYADDKKAGSVAAPTAGLHFTPRLLKAIKAKGVKIEYITLHVGMGTFAPVKTDDITKHKMHEEWVEVDKKIIENINKAKEENRRVISVGTTSARTLEFLWGLKPSERENGFKGFANIFIYPGYKFKAVDALITNFHLPKSTLLMLVSALAGKKNIDKAYSEAVERKFRFFSYGDAMFIY